jgi:hypothetical protein
MSWHLPDYKAASENAERKEREALRDQFAMAALTGLISRAPDFMFPDLSQKAYRFADAMVEARKEKTDGLP